jgi:hypothetical protein
MAEYRNEVLEALVHSEEFQKADADKKGKVLLAYHQATPAEREEFVYGSDRMEGLTLPDVFQVRQANVGQAEKWLASQPGRGIKNQTLEEKSLASQKGLLEAGLSMALPVVGSLPGQALKAARPLLGSVASAVGEGVGNVVANRAVNAIEGQPLGWTTMDTASLLAPIGVRGALGGLKAGTGPARRAYQRADEKTAADILEHRQKVDEAMVGRAEDMAAAEAAAATENKARSTAYGNELTERAVYNNKEAATVGQANTRAEAKFAQEKLAAQRKAEGEIRAADALAQAKTAEQAQSRQEARQKILTEFRDEVADIHRRTDLSNEQKDALIAQRVMARDQRVAAHNKAAAETSQNATGGIDAGDYRAAYKESSAAAEKAPVVDVTPLNKAAKAAGLDLESPVDPYSPMSGVISRLQKWGGGEPRPLGDLIDVHQELGRAVGKASGKQYKAAVEMYDTVGQMLTKQAAGNPDAATAVGKHFEGQRLWSRAKTIEEIQSAVDSNTTNPAPGEFRVKTPQIRDRINQLSDPKTNKFATSVTPEEWAQVHAEIDKLPTEPVGRPVTKQPAKTPNYSEAETKLIRRMGATREEPEPVKPDYSGVDYPSTPEPPDLERPVYKTAPVRPQEAKPDYSNVRPPYSGSAPEPTKPNLGPFPISHAIFGKMAGAEVANVTYPFAGANSAWIRAAGAVLGTAPHWISQILMATPKGRQIADSITAGKQSLRPQDLAALTTAARLLGGKPEDDNE